MITSTIRLIAYPYCYRNDCTGIDLVDGLLDDTDTPDKVFYRKFLTPSILCYMFYQ